MAIEKSLQDQKALQIANSEPEDPNERKRIDGVFVFLHNYYSLIILIIEFGY